MTIEGTLLRDFKDKLNEHPGCEYREIDNFVLEYDIHHHFRREDTATIAVFLRLSPHGEWALVKREWDNAESISRKWDTLREPSQVFEYLDWIHYPA